MLSLNYLKIAKNVFESNLKHMHHINIQYYIEISKTKAEVLKISKWRIYLRGLMTAELILRDSRKVAVPHVRLQLY